MEQHRTQRAEESKPLFVNTGELFLGRFGDLHKGTEQGIEPRLLVVSPYDVKH